jgi:hypothetical protein
MINSLKVVIVLFLWRTSDCFALWATLGAAFKAAAAGTPTPRRTLTGAGI